MPPINKTPVKKYHCIICFREFNEQHSESQPSNPRKVFKTCSNYLRPDIFTKYSKWDLFSDSEREFPFCSMCSSSGKKLADLNNQLEELQKEIKDFVKYFAKEIVRYRSSCDDVVDDLCVIQEDDLGQLRNAASIQSSVSSSSSIYSPQKVVTRKSDNIRNDGKNEVMPVHIDQIKEEFLFVENETEEDYDDDEDFNITDEIDDEGGSESEDYGNDPSFYVSPAPKSRVSHNNWTEILPLSEENLNANWRLLVQAKRQHGETKHYYCKIGGKKCPKRIMIKRFVGTHYYENGQPHRHYRTEPHGLAEETKSEIKKILDEEGNAKPTYIMEMLKLKGYDLDKKKLTSFLMYERRKILGKIRKGCQKKYKRENILGDSMDSTDGSEMKKKRGRPKGSLKVIIPPQAFRYGMGITKYEDSNDVTTVSRENYNSKVEVELNVNTENNALKCETATSNPSDLNLDPSPNETVIITSAPINTNYS